MGRAQTPKDSQYLESLQADFSFFPTSMVSKYPKNMSPNLIRIIRLQRDNIVEEECCSHYVAFDTP